MSEDKYQDLDELVEDTTIEDSEESSEVSTTEEDPIEELDSEENNKADKAEENKRKQIASWQARVDTGEVSLEEIPHKWIQNAIKPRADIDSVVESKVREAREAEKRANLYEQEKAELKSLNLDKDTLKEVIQEAKDLNADGVPMWKALQKAKKYHVQIAERENTQARRDAMALPKMGQGASKRQGEDWWKNASEEDLVEHALKNKPFGR